MNIREAILKAADHIERNPWLFNFNRLHVPPDCGTPGCALGWIGYFSGSAPHALVSCADDSATVKMGLGEGESMTFYGRMDRLVGKQWRRSAPLCAQAMRLYADKYHPEQALPFNELMSQLKGGTLEPLAA